MTTKSSHEISKFFAKRHIWNTVTEIFMNFYYEVNKTLYGNFFNSTGYPKKSVQIQTRLPIREDHKK